MPHVQITQHATMEEVCHYICHIRGHFVQKSTYKYYNIHLWHQSLQQFQRHWKDTKMSLH